MNTPTDKQRGFYWKSKATSPFGAQWQWRIGISVGGSDSEEEAVRHLKMMGASECEDVTNEGMGVEFGHNETSI